MVKHRTRKSPLHSLANTISSVGVSANRPPVENMIGLAKSVVRKTRTKRHRRKMKGGFWPFTSSTPAADAAAPATAAATSEQISAAQSKVDGLQKQLDDAKKQLSAIQPKYFGLF